MYGYLFAVFSIFLSLGIFLLGLIASNILIFDCIVFSFLSTFFIVGYIKIILLKNIHTVFIILMFCAIFLIMYLISKTKFGFWIISFIFTLLGSYIFGDIVYNATNNDKIWAWFIRIVSFIILAGLHMYSKYKYEDTEIKDKQFEEI